MVNKNSYEHEIRSSEVNLIELYCIFKVSGFEHCIASLAQVIGLGSRPKMSLIMYISSLIYLFVFLYHSIGVNLSKKKVIYLFIDTKFIYLF